MIISYESLIAGETGKVRRHTGAPDGAVAAVVVVAVGVAAGGGIRYTYYTLRFLDTVTALPLPAWTLPAHSPKVTRTCFFVDLVLSLVPLSLASIHFTLAYNRSRFMSGTSVIL